MSKGENEIKRMISEVRGLTEHQNDIITELTTRTTKIRIDLARNLIKIIKMKVLSG